MRSGRARTSASGRNGTSTASTGNSASCSAPSRTTRTASCTSRCFAKRVNGPSSLRHRGCRRPGGASLDPLEKQETTMSKQLAGKSAVVTGSTSGIGRAIATLFAAEGANVMLNGFGDGEEIEALRSSLEKAHGGKVRFHGADMSKPAEIADLVKAAETEF